MIGYIIQYKHTADYSLLLLKLLGVHLSHIEKMLLEILHEKLKLFLHLCVQIILPFPFILSPLYHKTKRKKKGEKIPTYRGSKCIYSETKDP